MATFLVAHGAWSAGWAWRKMRPLLRERGHELWTPTHTGLGERAHLASAGIDLETHIADLLGVLQFEDLKEVILIGHSYGGMVATGVADRARERIAALVYVDAFAPRDGESIFSLTPDRRAVMVEAARNSGDGSDAARHARGRPGLGHAAPRAATAEHLRAGTAPAPWRIDPAAPLHLLQALPARRPLPAVLRPRPARGLGPPPNRRQPQPTHYRTWRVSKPAGWNRRKVAAGILISGW